MTYRVQLRQAPWGYDAWVPELPGCATTGATEEEAVRNIRKAIAGRLDLESSPTTDGQVIEREVSVAPPAPIVKKAEPETLPGPVPIAGLPQLYVGGGVFALGIAGLIFYFTIEPQSSPALLFLPMITLAAGVLGLFFGALSLDAKPRTK